MRCKGADYDLADVTLVSAFAFGDTLALAELRLRHPGRLDQAKGDASLIDVIRAIGG